MNSLKKCWMLAACILVFPGAWSCSKLDYWPENTAERCRDHVDIDQDGLADCSDPDCAYLFPDICPSTGEICNDGIDNDGDGNTDCYDTDCGFEGAFEISCNDGVDNDCDGNTDAWDTDCWSPGMENCGDGLDNDGDGTADCWDTDCGFEGAIEISCDDDLDNDCDGNTDCWDPDCAVACGSTCTPSCGGKECGPDGCGGYCGFCGAGESCNFHGQCVETYVCMESTASGCSDCPTGWQDCLTISDDDGNPIRSICSKLCTTDADCGDCGACYEIEAGSYCLNYDAFAVEEYCPVDWRCSPD